jgi:hypothetical protein
LICKAAFLALGLTLALASASLAGPAGISGGDGRSLSAAVVLHKVTKDLDALQVEFDWLVANRPGWKVAKVEVLKDGDRYLDKMTLTKAGQTGVVYFDITAFVLEF